MGKLDGKVALITGSGRNIGRATALMMAAEGANIVVNARSNRDEAEATAAAVRELGVQALPVLADVAQKDQVDAMIDQAIAAFGRISTAEVWAGVQAAGSITTRQRIALRMAGTHAIRQSAEVVDGAYHLSGSTAIFADRAIQRRFQDAHVITQQIQGREAHYETAGQFYLGLEPKGVI